MCPDGRGHISASLRVPSPGRCEGQVSPRPLPCIQADENMRTDQSTHILLAVFYLIDHYIINLKLQNRSSDLLKIDAAKSLP